MADNVLTYNIIVFTLVQIEAVLRSWSCDEPKLLAGAPELEPIFEVSAPAAGSGGSDQSSIFYHN